MSLISFENIEVSFGTFQVLKNINFSVNKGEFLHILGPNGSGKTTLIKLLIGSLKPTKGVVNIEKVTMGYLPQKLTFNSKIPLTVFEVIYSGFPHPSLIPSKQENALIDQWLRKMEIFHLKNKSVITISGGQQQRVYLIRALVSNPQLIILDEPTSALDPYFREKFYDMLKEIQIQQGATVIHVTHDLTDAVKDGDYTLYIDQDIKFFGTYAEYKTFEHLGHHHD